MWRNLPPVTKHLLIINILVWAVTALWPGVADRFGANPDSLIAAGALFYPASPFFHIWQYATYMFLHGGFLHLFLNMYSLFLFGSVVERALGSRRFLLFFLLSGLGAGLFHTGVQFLQAQQLAGLGGAAGAAYSRLLVTPTVGASGAVYGILIGFAMLYPEARLTLLFPPVTLSAKWFALIFAGIELLTGIFMTSDGVAHFAHLGGMLVGWLLIVFWRRTRRI